MVFRSLERCPNQIGYTQMEQRKKQCPSCARRFCGAVRKQNDQNAPRQDNDHRCLQWPLKDGNGRCRAHRGDDVPMLSLITKDGTASASKYANFAPDGLVAKIVDSESDTELHSLRDEIGLVEARTKELLERVTSEESGATWKAAKKAMKQYRRSLRLAEQSESKSERIRHEQRAREYLDEVEQLIIKGEGDYLVWGEITDQLGQKRRLVESETKRAIAIGSMMTKKQALELTKELFDLVADNVHDTRALNAITIGLSNLIGGNTNTMVAPFLSNENAPHVDVIDGEVIPSEIDEI